MLDLYVQIQATLATVHLSARIIRTDKAAVDLPCCASKMLFPEPFLPGFFCVVDFVCLRLKISADLALSFGPGLVLNLLLFKSINFFVKGLLLVL